MVKTKRKVTLSVLLLISPMFPVCEQKQQKVHELEILEYDDDDYDDDDDGQSGNKKY